jgi:hypothetical protein
MLTEWNREVGNSKMEEIRKKIKIKTKNKTKV